MFGFAVVKTGDQLLDIVFPNAVLAARLEVSKFDLVV